MPAILIEDKNIPTGEDKLIPSDLPLFNPNTLLPGKNDIRQRSIGCCYLDAALQSMVSCDPDLIRQLFVEETPTTVTVRLFNDEKKACYYRIDKSILCDSGGKPLQAHAYLWPHLLEKVIAWHYRQDKGHNLRQMLTGGSPSHVFSVCLAHRSGIRFEAAFKLIMLQMIYRQFPEVDEKFDSNSIEEQLNKKTIPYDWISVSDRFNTELNQLNLDARRSVVAVIGQHRGLLTSNQVNELSSQFNLSLEAKITLQSYCTAVEGFWLKYINSLCAQNIMLAVSYDGEHDYTINRVFIGEDGSQWIELRNPWGHVNQDGNELERGKKIVTLDNFLLHSQAIFVCDKSKSLYNDQLLYPALTLTDNYTLATVYVSNIIQSMGIKNLLATEQTKVTKTIAQVLSQSRDLTDIDQSQSEHLQTALSEIIRRHIVECKGGLSYLSLGVFNNDYCTIDTSDEGLTPQDINQCLDSLFSEESKMWAYV